METWLGMGVLGLVTLIVLMPIIILVTAFVCALVLLRIMRGSLRNRTQESEETQLIQDIHRGLSAFEKRVENLEAILLERETEHGHQREL